MTIFISFICALGNVYIEKNKKSITYVSQEKNLEKNYTNERR